MTTEPWPWPPPVETADPPVSQPRRCRDCDHSFVSPDPASIRTCADCAERLSGDPELSVRSKSLRQ